MAISALIAPLFLSWISMLMWSVLIFDMVFPFLRYIGTLSTFLFPEPAELECMNYLSPGPFVLWQYFLAVIDDKC